MTDREAKKIIAVMMVIYPNYKPGNTDLTASTWADILSDYSYEQVNMGLKSYARSSTSGFAPSPGQVADIIEQTIHPADLNEQEAWSLVANALRNGIYNSEEEFNKLPETVQRAVGQPSQLRFWAMDEDWNEEVAKASFQRAYRAETARAAEYRKMPDGIKMLINSTMAGSPKAELMDKCRPHPQLPEPEREKGVPAPEGLKELVMNRM